MFHHIWINRDRPELPGPFAAYRDSWRNHHPTWQFRLWNLESIDFAPRRPELLARATSYAQLADVLRLEILLQHGGVYVDTDFECFRSIDALLDGVDVFFCSENGRVVTNSIIGATAGAPLIRRLLDAIRPDIGQAPPNEDTGPGFVTRELLGGGFDRTLTILPSRYFFPYAMGETRVDAGTAGDAYAAHHWAHSWAHPAERSWMARARRRLFGPAPRRPVLKT